MLCLSPDAFAWVTSFLSLQQLLVLRAVCRSFRSLSLRAAVYAVRVDRLSVSSLDESHLIRLSTVHPHLRHLVVPFSCRQQVTSASLSFLFALFPSLSSLSLTAASSTLSELPLPYTACLSSLSLTSTQLPSAAFASLSLLSSLTSLNLSDSAGLDDAALLLLSSSRLTQLDISRCSQVTDTGIAHLLGVQQHRHAHTLHTLHTQLKRQGRLSPPPPFSPPSHPSLLPASSAPPPPPLRWDHVGGLMEAIGALGEHGGLSMLSRSMSLPSFARHTQPLQLQSSDGRAAEADTEDSASPSPPSPRSPSTPTSPSSPCHPPPASPPQLYSPPPLCLSLRHLSLAYCRGLSDASAAMLAFVAVSMCPPSSAWSSSPLDPSSLTLFPLASLDLSFLPLLSDFAACCLSLLSHLQSLTLAASPLLSDAALHSLTSLPYLSVLSLSSLPRLTHTALAQLAGLLSLSSLTLSSLHLLTDHSVALLASLPLLHSLSLSLLPQLTDRSLQSLAGSTSLLQLSLSQLHISRRGWFALIKCRSLRRVQVKGCKEIGEEDRIALSLHRPDVLVVES